MPRYRRVYVPGGTYFFTVVTCARKPLFADEQNRALLRLAFDETHAKRPYETIAMCLLPDHLHTLWKLPDGDSDFSARWARIKSLFTRSFQKTLRVGQGPPYAGASRRRKREANVWGRRFWEHAIRNGEELRRHVDYIHYNPVKHGLVEKVSDWPWSTYHRYIAEGLCEPGWGDLRDITADIDARAE